MSVVFIAVAKFGAQPAVGAGSVAVVEHSAEMPLLLLSAVVANTYEGVGACSVVLLLSRYAPVYAAFFPLPYKCKCVLSNVVEVTCPGSSPVQIWELKFRFGLGSGVKETSFISILGNHGH